MNPTIYLDLLKEEVICPVCKQPMVAETNLFGARFMCMNHKCKAYLQRTPSFPKNFMGEVALPYNLYKTKRI